MGIYEQIEVNDFLVMEPGVTSLKVLSETKGKHKDLKKGEEYETLDLKVEIAIPVERAGQKLTWSIRWKDDVGSRSLLGQLRRIAGDNNMSLVGLQLEIIRAGEDKATRYTVKKVGPLK